MNCFFFFLSSNGCHPSPSYCLPVCGEHCRNGRGGGIPPGRLQDSFICRFPFCLQQILSDILRFLRESCIRFIPPPPPPPPPPPKKKQFLIESTQRIVKTKQNKNKKKKTYKNNKREQGTVLRHRITTPGHQSNQPNPSTNE